METYYFVCPENEKITYTGRIEFEKKTAPVFAYACSSFRFCVKASEAVLAVSNLHSYYENSLGILVDGKYRGKIVLHDGEQNCGEPAGKFELRLEKQNAAELQPVFESFPEEARFFDLSAFLDGGQHEITVFKRMDACHYFTFLGLLLPENTELFVPSPKKKRRIEVYGDSVSCGEVSEAIGRCGMDDPEGHNGIYSNSFYSYSWILARKLEAEIHDVSQGGISLMDGDGYFNGPVCTGMLSCYDKILYHPGIGKTTNWEFEKFIPHVVIVAIGQNDAHPVNCMGEDYEGEAAQKWRNEYKGFIRILRGKYPKAQIILTTTILGHDKAWDQAIDQVCRELAQEDGRVHHFLYSLNGEGTSGHIRRPEAEKMAEEMQDFLKSLGEEIWED